MRWYNFIYYIDYVLPLYLGLIFYLSERIRRKHIETNPIYKYYTLGLFYRIAAGIAICLVYVFHYGEADTTNYFLGARAISKMFFKDPGVCISLLAGNRTEENWSFFDITTGWPLWSMYYEKPDSFAASRLAAPFVFLGFNSFLAGVAVLNFFIYKLIWRFYEMCCEIYPKLYKQLAIAILFVPSVAFWGSGIMKDTFTLACALYFTVNFYNIFIKKVKLPANIIAIVINSIIIMTLKPYILVALLPATLIWGFYNRIKGIHNQTMRIFAAPFLLVMGMTVGMLILSLLGSRLGAYGSMDTMIKKAQVTQQDLIREEAYGENKFNIGEFEPTLGGILGKAPIAITAGLYRPFIWEAGNVFMLLSGMENLIFLLMSGYILLKVGPFKSISYIINEPLLLFSIIFTIEMAFSCGLTAANFGALTRYKIPCLPFFTMTLLIIYQNKIKVKNKSV